eukprot:gene31681-40978_t
MRELWRNANRQQLGTGVGDGAAEQGKRGAPLLAGSTPPQQRRVSASLREVLFNAELDEWEGELLLADVLSTADLARVSAPEELPDKIPRLARLRLASHAHEQRYKQ